MKLAWLFPALLPLAFGTGCATGAAYRLEPPEIFLRLEPVNTAEPDVE